MIKRTITVSELIEVLKEMPQTHEVYWFGGDKRMKISDVVNVGDVVDLYNYEVSEDDDTYDAFGVNTKNSFNTPPKESK